MQRTKSPWDQHWFYAHFFMVLRNADLETVQCVMGQQKEEDDEEEEGDKKKQDIHSANFLSARQNMWNYSKSWLIQHLQDLRQWHIKIFCIFECHTLCLSWQK